MFQDLLSSIMSWELPVCFQYGKYKSDGEGKQIIPIFALESNTFLWLASGLIHSFKV